MLQQLHVSVGDAAALDIKVADAPELPAVAVQEVKIAQLGEPALKELEERYVSQAVGDEPAGLPAHD